MTEAVRIAIAIARADAAAAIRRAEVLERELRSPVDENTPKRKTPKPKRNPPPPANDEELDETSDAAARQTARAMGIPIPLRRAR